MPATKSLQENRSLNRAEEGALGNLPRDVSPPNSQPTVQPDATSQLVRMASDQGPREEGKEGRRQRMSFK